MADTAAKPGLPVNLGRRVQVQQDRRDNESYPSPSDENELEWMCSGGPRERILQKIGLIETFNTE